MWAESLLLKLTLFAGAALTFVIGAVMILAAFQVFILSGLVTAMLLGGLILGVALLVVALKVRGDRLRALLK